ncbi:unnamed protein product [Closterium sp. Naga37s-1]|nr:unnamed protein product [Closterium sp. Naga37s-1]
MAPLPLLTLSMVGGQRKNKEEADARRGDYEMAERGTWLRVEICVIFACSIQPLFLLLSNAPLFRFMSSPKLWPVSTQTIFIAAHLTVHIPPPFPLCPMITSNPSFPSFTLVAPDITYFVLPQGRIPSSSTSTPPFVPKPSFLPCRITSIWTAAALFPIHSIPPSISLCLEFIIAAMLSTAPSLSSSQRQDLPLLPTTTTAGSQVFPSLCGSLLMLSSPFVPSSPLMVSSLAVLSSIPVLSSHFVLSSSPPRPLFLLFPSSPSSSLLFPSSPAFLFVVSYPPLFIPMTIVPASLSSLPPPAIATSLRSPRFPNAASSPCIPGRHRPLS